MLEKQLARAYSPARHWTSCLRSKAGISPFESPDVSQSTFTIDDELGAFTELLIQNGYKAAGAWRGRPTYHIEVNTSEAGLLSKFYLDQYQIQKVCLTFHLIIRLQSPKISVCRSIEDHTDTVFRLGVFIWR